MARRNLQLDKLSKAYLFAEIANRTRAFQQQNPDARLLSLGIGDTTEPLPQCVTDELGDAAGELATREGYQGYGEVEGDASLRQSIADTFYDSIELDEVFISDGAKCDLARLQFLFGKECHIGVQDPAYPVYTDASILAGQNHVHLLPCTPENNFFPALPENLDILYFCAPNNPTGMAATYAQLEELVQWAQREGVIIIYDTAYAAFIQDDALPRTIYAIPGAKSVAIETSSFSKLAGFTGLRLGWTVVPHELKFADGTSVRDAWMRVVATTFNGSSHPVQAAGRALLQPEGLKAVQTRIAHYLENARFLRAVLQEKGIPVYGGIHSPYLWAHFEERDSWEVFDELLHDAHLITTPGVGFGPSGEGFVRFSAFGRREEMEEAAERLRKALGG